MASVGQLKSDPVELSYKLLEISKHINSNRELSEIVQYVTDVATSLTQAQFGSFFYNVNDPAGGSYTLYTLSGVRREAFSNFPMPRATHLFGPTFRGEDTIVSGNIRRDHRFGKNPPYHGMPKGHLPVVSYLATPVISSSGYVHGGLFFGHELEDQFLESDVMIVETLATHTAVALDNARLIRELTHAQQTAEEAAKANFELYARAEEASKAKDNFISVLSHELRTPLTPVHTILQMLEEEDSLSEESRHLVTVAVNNVQQEITLINDLLDLSKLSNNKLELEPEQFLLSEFLEVVIAAAQIRAQERAHRIALNLNIQGVMVTADRSRLRQVIENLISNALKFSEPGSTIWIRAHHHDRSVYVAVRDEGIGMTPETISRVFNPFEQGERKITRTFGGLGLGLAIAKKLIELHGGDIRAESDGPNKGSTFVVTIPLV